MNEDLYKILGVERDASQDDIKKAFRKLAAIHHPDKGGDADLFKKILHAYQILYDNVSRAKYDNDGVVEQFTEEQQIQMMARDGLISIFTSYVASIRSRKDIYNKNLLKEINKEISIQERRLYENLTQQMARMDAVDCLKGRFNKKGENDTFFDNVIKKEIDKILQVINLIKFDIKVRQRMKKILSEYTYETLQELLKELGQDVYPHYQFDMSPPK